MVTLKECTHCIGSIIFNSEVIITGRIFIWFYSDFTFRGSLTTNGPNDTNFDVGEAILCIKDMLELPVTITSVSEAEKILFNGLISDIEILAGEPIDFVIKRIG